MPLRAIEQLITSQGALILALNAGDVVAVEAATARVARALDRMRDDRAPLAGDDRRLAYALRQAETARSRVNFLTGHVAHHLERLTGRRQGCAMRACTNAGNLRQTG